MTGLASGVGQRYTVGDVTSSPDLHQAALNFIRGYRGDFEFLVQMKEIESMQHAFTDGQAAAVLNCMRFDPQGLRYINQAKEADMQRIAQDVTTEVLGEHLPKTATRVATLGYQSAVDIVAERPPLSLVPGHPTALRVKTTWKRFWIEGDLSPRSHHIDAKKSRGVLWVQENEIHYTAVSLCGLVTRRSIPGLERFRNGRTNWTLGAQPEKQVCKICEKKLEEV